jgi:hypothetical protein
LHANEPFEQSGRVFFALLKVAYDSFCYQLCSGRPVFLCLSFWLSPIAYWIFCILFPCKKFLAYEILKAESCSQVPFLTHAHGFEHAASIGFPKSIFRVPWASDIMKSKKRSSEGDLFKFEFSAASSAGWIRI